MATATGSTIGALRVVIGADTTGLQRGLRDAGNRIEGFRKQSLVAAASISAIGAAAAAAFSVSALKNYADSWSDMRSVVGAAIGDMSGASDMMTRLVDVANASYSPLAQTAEIYSRNVSVLRELGKGADEAADFTESLNHMLVLTATRGERAASVQNALSKAMAVGKLQADGLETVLAHGGEVAQALASELGTTVNSLRSFASEGKITGEVIANAIIKRLDDVRERAGEMPATMGDAFTRIQANITEFVGKIDQATGASGALAEITIKFADAIRVAGDYVVAFGQYAAPAFNSVQAALAMIGQYADYALVALAGFYAPALVGGIGLLTTSLAVGLVGAIKAVTAAMLANPIGAISAALVAAGYAAYKFRDQINEAIGIDVVAIAKNAANTVLNSFVAAYEDIKFVWSNFGDMMGGAVVGGINVAIRAINALITGALSGINSLVDAVNKIPGVDIGKIGDRAKIDLLNNEYSARLVDAVKERNAKIAEIMSTDRFASAPGGMVLTDDPEKPAANDFLFDPLGGGGASAGSSEKQSQAELQALREQLEARLQMLREFVATEQELEIFRHGQRLEDLRELWEAGIIPTEAEMMELREDLEQKHQDRLSEIKEAAERERMAIAEKAAQAEINQRRAVVSAAIGFLDQLAGESKAAAIASIAISKGLAIAEAIQNTAVAVTAAMKYDPTGAMAARVALMGKAQVGLIAATGLAQAASVSSRGTGGLQGGASGSVGGRSSAPSSGGMGSTGGGAGPRVNINLIEDRNRAGQVDVNRSDDEEVDADVFVADIRGGGPRAQALQETFNLRRTGS